MPILTTRDYLRIRHLLIKLWDQEHGGPFDVLPGHAQHDLHDFFAFTVPMSDKDAIRHRTEMTKAFPSLPQSAGRAFEALCAHLEHRPNKLLDRYLETVTSAAAVSGKSRRIRVTAISRPEIDTHYLAKALLRLAREDDGTLMKQVMKLREREERKRR